MKIVKSAKERYENLTQDQVQEFGRGMEGKRYTFEWVEGEFTEMLQNEYPMVNICGFEHDPVEVLLTIDPMGFNESLEDWLQTGNDYIEDLQCPGVYLSRKDVEDRLTAMGL